MVSKDPVVRFARAPARGLAVASLVGLLVLLAGARSPPPGEPVPVASPPSSRRFPDKPTAPVALELLLVEGGAPGETARVQLVATPWQPVGRLDLNLEVPEGLRVLGGSTAESAPAEGGRRSVEVELEVPPTGVYRLTGVARMVLEDGKVLARTRVLDLPAGARAKGVDLPRVTVPGGGTRIEIPGVAF